MNDSHVSHAFHISHTSHTSHASHAGHAGRASYVVHNFQASCDKFHESHSEELPG